METSCDRLPTNIFVFIRRAPLGREFDWDFRPHIREFEYFSMTFVKSPILSRPPPPPFHGIYIDKCIKVTGYTRHVFLEINHYSSAFYLISLSLVS